MSVSENISIRNPRTFYTEDVLTIVRQMAPAHTSTEIAHRINSTSESVRYACSRYGIKLGSYKTSRSSVRLDGKSIAKVRIEVLNEEASRRGIKPGTLARLLLETIARDNLFEAVLDMKDT